MGTSASPIGRDEEAGSDQRQSARKVISAPIAVELQPGQEAWIRDLGEGGLSVSSSSPVAMGSSATLRFELPATDSVIDAAGVVAWSDDHGRAGLRFTRVEPTSAAALRKWLTSSPSTYSSRLGGAYSDNDLSRKVASLREVADLQAIISTEHLETSAALDLIVRRMAELTRATGGAIAVREGQDVFCRASFGNAPDVGVKLSSSSLSGECLRSGTVVIIEDSENDPLVNPEVCRQVNFRSLLILPVASGTEIIGIAEVLSPTPRNFEGGDVLVVSFLTDLIASIAAPRKEISAPEYTPFTVLQALEEIQIPDSQSVVSAIPAAVSTATAPTTSDQGAAISPVRTEQKIPAQQAREHFENAISIRLPARGLRISVIGVLLATVFSLLAYLYYRHSPASPKPSNIPPTVAPTGTSAATPSQPLLSTSTTGTSSNPGRETVASRTVRPASIPSSRANKPEVTELQVIQGHTVSPKPAPEPNAPEPSPMNMGEITRGSSTLPASIVAAKTATPELGPIPSQGVVEGKLIKRVLPQYPEMARRA